MVITWDGRLDNRDELMPQLHTDLAIVAAAFERWRTDSFAKLIGDWALAIWNQGDRSLVLARDYVGIRHLFYYPKQESVVWCTNLAVLVLLANRLT
jgi:asparagine synthase (glutamine-hydrolysing)